MIQNVRTIGMTPISPLMIRLRIGPAPTGAERLGLARSVGWGELRDPCDGSPRVGRRGKPDVGLRNKIYGAGPAGSHGINLAF